MVLPLYQVDAFTRQVFHGNPAAVVPLDQWLPTDVMQSIAAENNLAETVFFIPLAGETGCDYHIRWFTPEVEVRLCGHATLAAAFVLFERLRPELSTVVFDSLSGPLTVERDGERLTLDFPTLTAEPCETPDRLASGLGTAPVSTLLGRDYVAVYETEAEVRALRPNFSLLHFEEALGVIATAPGDNCDFVSRFFAPGAGIPEDPVTGSAHCLLAPYWAERLGKTVLQARQVSLRGGELLCEHRGDRVLISGHAVLYLEGTIRL